MGTVTRTRLLMAAFCLSLCGLGAAATVSLRAQSFDDYTTVIDNDNRTSDVPGFTTQGFVIPTANHYPQGYNGDTAFVTRYPNATTREAIAAETRAAAATATWTFTNLRAGNYVVVAAYGAHKERTTAAPYTLQNENITTPIDQTKVPDYIRIFGRAWAKIGWTTVGENGTIVVTLKAGPTKITMADAVAVQWQDSGTQTPPTVPPTVPPTTPPTTPPPAPQTYCGDGIVATTLGEQCDDGNLAPNDGCTHECKIAACGDTIVAPSLGEQCDPTQPRSATTGFGCSEACKITYCGDAILNDGEQCDDGNRRSGDGCNAQCVIETRVDVQATLTGPASMRQDETSTYMLNIKNVGATQATLVHTMSDVPRGFEYVPAASSTECTLSSTDFQPRRVSCYIGTLEPGAAWDFKLTLKALSNFPCGANSTLAANVLTFEADTIPVNNRATVSTNVACAIVLGDLSKDGTIASNDATMALRIAESGATPTADELARGDVNKNGKITKVDALLILDRISGNIASLPAICGDLNNDATVTAVDGTVASRIANNTLAPAATLTQRTLADANRDGKIDQTDVQIILDVVSRLREECFVDAIVLGDVNGNGQIQSNDATLISLHVAGTQLLTAEQITRADVNKNGKITNADAYLVSARIVGLITLPAKFGDVTGDMNVTSMDASRVSQMIDALALRDDGSFYASMLNLVAQLNATDITPQMKFLADVNRDGVINQLDVNLIMQAAVGIHFELPVENIIACADGVDNDLDGLSDLADRGCANPQDANEGDGLADLAVDLTADATGYARGSTITLNSILHNYGPDNAMKPTEYTITVPAGITYDAARSNSACVMRGAVLACTIPSLKVGNTSMPLRFVVGQAAVCGPIVFTSSVTISSQPEADFSNNTKRLDLSVTCPVTPPVVTPSNCTIPAAVGGARWQNPRNVLDVDGNRVIEVKDRTELLYFVRTYGVGTPAASVTSTMRPDVNGDNSIDVQDLLLLGTHLTRNCGQQTVTLASATLSCVGNASTVTFNYAARYFNNTTAHVLPGAGTTPVYGSVNSSGTSAAITLASPTTIQTGTSVRLCHGNDYSVCSAAVAVTGAGCGTTTTPPTATLNIAVKSIGSNDVAVKNSDNINLLRYEARADGGDILFTQLTARAAVGNLLNGQDYTLWVDTNADQVVDTILESGVAVQNNLVTFDSLAGGGFVIPDEESAIFEIHADIASSLTGNQLELALATTSANYVQAEANADGASLAGIRTNGACTGTCAITVTTVPSKLFTLVNQGDLFVSLDSTPMRSRQLLAGTLGDGILRMQFRAQNEAIDVTDLQFTSRGSNASSVDRIELYKDGATTAFATATISGCGSDQVNRTDNGITVSVFCANMENGQLIVNEGENLDVIVRPRMKSDEQGALSGQDVRLFVSSLAISDNSTGQGAIRARGRESSSNLAANDGDNANEGEVFIGRDTSGPNVEIAGNRNVTVLSKITTITNANPDPDNTAVPTGIAPIGQFRFTAASNSNTLNGLNRATLQKLTFTVVATNATLDQTAFNIYNKADSSTKKSCTAIGGGGIGGTTGGVTTLTYVVECSGLDASDIDTQLESGESSTFVLETSVLNPQVMSSSSSSVQVSFENFATPFPLSSNITWLDRDAGSLGTGQTTSSTFTWIEYGDTVIRSTAYRN